MKFSLLPSYASGLFRAISLVPFVTGAAMMFVLIGGGRFWNSRICENKFLMGLFSGLGSVQSSPQMMVNEAKGSRSVSDSSK